MMSIIGSRSGPGAAPAAPRARFNRGLIDGAAALTRPFTPPVSDWILQVQVEMPVIVVNAP
ncbi:MULTISPECIES: hypothetical protein [unclassified Methylobacterium]|uniref:hypothetical protein n=1 Tax=unclassified Methylobacterium TaxID=2615210 RepID=UPI0012376353|nr:MULTISPECIES: hypothetical protein [Methylobacterium]WFT78141.1 hypothetical protein QA634_22970 [Methylobacterium nodulans]